MDIEKFNALASLVREARQEDADTLRKMEEATAIWKAANAKLTDYNKALNDFLFDEKNRATAIPEGAKR